MSELSSYRKELPDGEIVAVHDRQEAPKSPFVLTAVDFVEVFAFACQIKGQLFTSAWVGENQSKDVAREAMKQILFIKQGGWYDTGETAMDDMNLHREPLFRCAYCNAESTNVKGPCSCRKEGAQLRQ